MATHTLLGFQESLLAVVALHSKLDEQALVLVLTEVLLALVMVRTYLALRGYPRTVGVRQCVCLVFVVGCFHNCVDESFHSKD